MRITPTFRRSNGRKPVDRRVMWSVAIVAALLGATAIGVGLNARRPSPNEGAPKAAELALESTSSMPATDTAGRVEMPEVVGASLAEARAVLDAAGFSIHLVPGSSSAESSTVVSQEPAPGTVAEASGVVTLTTSAARPPKKAAPASGDWIVVIDPGHQRRSNSAPEPIGPGAKETKPAVTGGTTGAITGLPEFEVVLQISMNLRTRLERRGVKVIMTRTTNDVNLSNSQRAEIANKAGADLFVRVHGDGSPDSNRSGISTLYPASSIWTKNTWLSSKSAASAVQAGAVKETGAVDLGIVARTDISGFNYAKMPSLLIECGFMSNPVEDRLLSSPHYQDKLAEGIADGVMTYLNGSGN